MALKGPYEYPKYYIGLSTDVKPTASSGAKVGDEFFETDTLATYIYYDDAVWYEKVTSAGAGDVATDAVWDALGDIVVGTGANTADNVNIAAQRVVGRLTGENVKGLTAAEMKTLLGYPTAASEYHIDDVLTALGIASEAVNFGTFTGSTINDSVTAKAALQALETAVEGTLSATKAILVAATELTIATDAVTVTQTAHFIDTEADAASDNLSTISGGTAGQLLAIRAIHADRSVVVKNNVGNIYTGGSDITLDDVTKYLLFIYDGTLTKWVVVGGSAAAVDLTAPGPIGSVTPSTGKFTTVQATTGGGAGKLFTSDTDGLGSWGVTLAAPGPIGGTTPAAVYSSPSIQKGPAIINAPAGTVTATASTTVTFSDPATAILAGYNATNPVLGTTLISNALTRYIVSWTNATTAVVDTAVTWAGTAITSVQLPIAADIASDGTLKQATAASGKLEKPMLVADGSLALPSIAIGAANTGFYWDGGGDSFAVSNGGVHKFLFASAYQWARGYFIIGSGGSTLLYGDAGNNANFGINQSTFGTSAAKVLAMGSGTAPTTSPADAAQMWVGDKSGVAGHAGFHMRDEFGNTGPVAFAQLKVVTHSATENALASQMYGHNHLVTGAYTVSLPTAVVGYHVEFMATTAAAFSVDVVTGTDVIYLNGTALAAGNKITSDSSIRASVTVKCVVTGFYEITATQGLFIDGGA